MDITDLNAQLLDANVAFNAAVEEKRCAYNNYKAHIIHVIEANVDMSICKVDINYSGAVIRVGSHKIELYFEEHFSHERSLERELKINFGCFGSFDCSDTDAIKFCETLGHVAGIMSVLEQQLFKTPEAEKLIEAYDNANHMFLKCDRALNDIKTALSKIEKDAREMRIRASLTPGRRIIVRPTTVYGHPAVIKTIAHVMPKNFVFAEDYGKRTPIDVAVSNIISGRWTLQP